MDIKLNFVYTILYKVYNIHKAKRLGVDACGTFEGSLMWSKIKHCNFRKLILYPLAQLVVAAILFSIWFVDNRDFILTDGNIFYYYAEEIDPSKYYKFTLYDIYDYYAYDDEGKYYITEISNYDSYYYIGFFFPNSLEEKILEIEDNTWAYMDGNGNDNVNFSGRCYMYSMDDDEIEFFKSYLTDMGAPEDMFWYKTLVYVPFSDCFTIEFYVGCIFLGITVISLIAVIIILITKKYAKEYKQCLQNYSLTNESLDMYMQDSTKVKHTYFGHNYLVNAYFSSFVISYEDIMWTLIVPYTAPNGVRYFKNSSVVIKTGHGIYVIQNIKESVAYDIVARINKLAINLDNNILAMEKNSEYLSYRLHSKRRTLILY